VLGLGGSGDRILAAMAEAGRPAANMQEGAARLHNIP